MRISSIYLYLTFFIQMLAAFPVHAEVIDPGSYNFPYQDPYQSTLISELLKADKNYQFKKGTLTGLHPGRDHVPYVEGRDQLFYEFHPGPKTDSPLIFVLAGLGGEDSDGIAEFLADHLGRNGFAVVTLSSPYYWRFAVVGSTSGIPGIATADVEDLYSEMKLILQKLNCSLHVQPSQMGMIGYSMGAFEGVRLAELDRAAKELNFIKFILINPPMDLSYGIKVLDRMYMDSLALGGQKISEIENVLITRGLALLNRDIDAPGYFVGLEQAIDLDDDGARFLISQSLESTAPDLVMVTQSMNQTLPESVMPTPPDIYHEQLRELYAKRFMLGDYMKKIVVPALAASTGFKPGSQAFEKALLNEVSLKEHLDEIVSDARVNIMHNADDFITDPKDLAVLESAMPTDRLVVYPYGGHVENIWFPENMQHIMDVFGSLKN